MMESYSNNGRDAWTFKQTASMIFRSEVSDIAAFLSSVPDSDLFKRSFADTVVSSFSSRISYAGDSVWVFESLDAQISLSSASARMLPEQMAIVSGTQTTPLHFWEVSVAGKYDEGNGYSADFGTDGPVLINWTGEMSFNGVWSLNQCAAGNFTIKTFLDRSPLDSGTLVCKGTEYDFFSSIGNITDN